MNSTRHEALFDNSSLDCLSITSNDLERDVNNHCKALNLFCTFSSKVKSKLTYGKAL